MLEDASTNNIHLFDQYGFSDVIFVMKSTSTWAFITFLGSYEILNSESSTTHFFIFPANFCLNNICLVDSSFIHNGGVQVSNTSTLKITRVKPFFSIFW